MKRANDALIGLTVITVTLATIGGIVWAKALDVGGGQQEVTAHFRDVGNARVGNAVVIRGVIGGRIDAIELEPDAWVNVRMRLDPDVRLPRDPVVLLNESSLFGDWQATVLDRASLPRDSDLRRAIDDASGRAGMLPGASQPGIGKLTAVTGQLAGDVASVAARVDTAFNDQAASELRQTFHDVAALSSTLRGIAQSHASDLDTLTVQLRSAVGALRRTAETVDLTARRLDSASTSTEVRQLVENFSVASIELRRAATQVRDLTSRIAVTQQRADAFLADGDSVLAKINHGQGSLGLMVNDPTFYHRTDSLVTSLRALVDDFRANPKRYVTIRIF
jgi:phospholipid/cholesterol/gamma-HCH transport system substrate-binding protein